MPMSYSVPVLSLQRDRLSLLIALALLIVLSGFFVREATELRRAMVELRANNLVRIEIRNVLVYLLDAETGQRGFLLTGDGAYLEPYNQSRQKIRDTLQRAKNLGRNYPRLMLNMQKLTLLSEKKLIELNHTISEKKLGNDASAMSIVQGGSGKEMMDEVRLIIQSDLDWLRSSSDAIMEEMSRRYLQGAIILILIVVLVVALALTAWNSISDSAGKYNNLARRLALEASHDALCGLPNRRLFDQWSKTLIVRCEQENRPFNLMLIDLDGFKQVNDEFGHAVGDHVLSEVAIRFQSVLKKGEFLARLGGDEFGLLIDGDLTYIEASRLGKQLIESITNCLHPQLQDRTVGASIGVASYPIDGLDMETLIQAADKALYFSKNNGRGIISFRKNDLYL